MRPLLLTLIVAAFSFAQAPVPQEPPEEDVNIETPKEYTLNPLQAAKELKIGKFYLKKGSTRAAVRRFEEALKWDPNLAEAYLRLGEAHAKAGDNKAAREAWARYIELEPDSKDAAALKKKLGRS